MDYTLLKNKYDRCCQLVTEKHLSEAFQLLDELIAFTQNNDFRIALDNYRETYQNILKYSFGEVEDPEKKNVYFKLLRNVLELADAVFEYTIVSKQLLPYSFEKKYLTAFNYAGSEAVNTQQLFNYFWLTDRYLAPEMEEARNILKARDIPWWNKSVLVSAITMSCERYFDESKLLLLTEAYLLNEKQVKQRALIGLLMCLYRFDQRLFLYPKIKAAIESLHEDADFEKQVESVFIQFAKTKDTEKISQKFRDEIYPEMARMQSRIYDKLDLKNILPDPLQDDKNPDWENVFHDSPGLLNKLEEFSMLQMEGSDVFLSTFSMLKHFDFFNPISNWFVPFHKENTSLSQALHDDTGQFNEDEFTTNMEKSSILCNSDKYSFCFNMKYVPAKERSMMVQMFNMETDALKEINADDDLLNKPTWERIIYTQYIQDLYRFNKLFPQKQGLFDIFSTKIDFQNTSFYQWLLTDETIIRNIGEFYFEKGHYKDAIEIFNLLDKSPKNFELWQKIAYSWQKLGNYDKALEFYLRAELTDMRTTWNTKKVAQCYRRLGNLDKALEYYLEAEKAEPENLQLQANLAHTYFENKDYENAVRIYFKVEYLSPDNQKIQRPIAWCSLMLGKLDTAKKYFEKITESEGTQHDLLNLGHVEWCLGNKREAIEKYKQSLAKSGNNTQWFTEEFLADSDILVRNNIDPLDIPLMRDYVIS